MWVVFFGSNLISDYSADISLKKITMPATDKDILFYHNVTLGRNKLITRQLPTRSSLICSTSHSSTACSSKTQTLEFRIQGPTVSSQPRLGSCFLSPCAPHAAATAPGSLACPGRSAPHPRRAPCPGRLAAAQPWQS